MIFWIIQDGIGLSYDGLPLRQITKKVAKKPFLLVSDGSMNSQEIQV